MFFFDGAPDFPSVDRVWQLCARHRITLLGLSPMLVRALMPHGTDYVTRHDLSQLRAVGATGSPWGPSSWRWIFENVLEGRKPIFNYTGGTEISGGILAGSLFKPLKPAAFGGPIPGMDADVVDEAGNPVRGEVGDLIVRQPWIGMTRGFWRANERYLDTYWQRLDGIWVHGDFCAIDEDGMWYILGRSDDTINIAGKRLGPAEVETLVNAHPDVTESAAVAVPHPLKDNDVVVFVVLKPGVDGQRTPCAPPCKSASRLSWDAPLRPKEVRFCAALPKTRNAKVMHRLIRASYLGEDPGDISALEDPRHPAGDPAVGMNLLSLEDVSKQFSERLLLDTVSLSINAGERIGLIGVNGSGKTTLLRIIAGLEVPDNGRLTVWGGVRVEMVQQEPQLDERRHSSRAALPQQFAPDAPPARLRKRQPAP